VPPLNDSTGIWHYGCTLHGEADARANDNDS